MEWPRQLLDKVEEFEGFSESHISVQPDIGLSALALSVINRMLL